MRPIGVSQQQQQRQTGAAVCGRSVCALSSCSSHWTVCHSWAAAAANGLDIMTCRTQSCSICHDSARACLSAVHWHVACCLLYDPPYSDRINVLNKSCRLSVYPPVLSVRPFSVRKSGTERHIIWECCPSLHSETVRFLNTAIQQNSCSSFQSV